MSISWDKPNKCWRYQFDRRIQGSRHRASRLPFRAAGLKPKLTRSTARRARASTPLQLACSDKTP
jgi:hypothetical protein